MNIFTNVNDEEVIEKFKNQNLTNEDYNDVFNEPEFLRNNSNLSTWETEGEISNIKITKPNSFSDDEVDEIDRYAIEHPYGYHEIELYDNHKSFEENFEKGSMNKYILIQINKDRKPFVTDYTTVMPTPQSICLIDIEKVEDYGNLEIIPIDYDTLFGLRLLSFQKYKSEFFSCDERVMFESFLIKYQRFDFKAFYWSFTKIFEEVGIKKDRATKIINKFIKLGIASKSLVKTQIEKKPMQINYYDLHPDRIFDLIPQIYEERERLNLEAEIKKYLIPVLKKN